MTRPFRNLARATSRAEIFQLLAGTAVAAAQAAGAAVLERLGGGGLRVAAACNLPMAAAVFEDTVLDATTGERMLARCEGRFGLAHLLTIPNVGALLLFFAEPDARTDEGLEVAEALIEVAALSLDKVQQHAEWHASREALERTEKLRALGQMAAGISHDLKNLLNPLSLHLQLLKRTVRQDGPGAEDAIAAMEQVLRRGVETVERLRDFSRQTPERRMVEVDLDPLVHEAVELSRPRITSSQQGHRIHLVEEFGQPPSIHAHPTELVAAVLNLTANAIDALDEGGRVVVSTGAADGGAWVRVHDDGPGIPEEIRARIFEPFFTTKGNEGTGLGLAMVYAFVQRHGGKLSLESAAGCGTTFTLWLPCGS